MKASKLITIIAVAALAVGAFAQGQGRRGGFGQNPFSLTSLINRDEVKEELKLADDQKTKLTDLATSMQQKRRDAFQASGIQFGPDMSDDDRKKMAEIGVKVNSDQVKEISGILNADQLKRLKEISIQHEGNAAAADPIFQSDLGITDEQKGKIAELQKKQTAAMMELFQKMRNQEIDQAGFRTAMTSNQTIMSDEIGKILTEDQKGKIKSMSGTPFTLKEAGN